MTSLFPTQQRGRGAGLCGLETSTPILVWYYSKYRVGGSDW